MENSYTRADNAAEERPEIKNNVGWQRRLLVTVAAAAICTFFLGGAQAWNYLHHKPELIYPPDVEAALRVQFSGTPLISKETIDNLKRLYQLDPPPTCVVGRKYGGLCQDGYVDRYLALPDSPLPSQADFCVGHGGAKTWIECR